jgi:hypothetical protein
MFVFCLGVILCLQLKGESQIESLMEQGAEENIKMNLKEVVYEGVN